MAKSTIKIAGRKKQPISFSISTIDLIKGQISCPHDLDYTKDEYTYEYNISINIVKDQSIIQVVVEYIFNLGEHLLLDLNVSTDFGLVNIDEVIINDQIRDPNFAYFLITMTVNHARGIQSTIIKNSPIHDKYMPSVDREIVIKQHNQPENKP